MKKFEVTGKFEKKSGQKKFTKLIEAENEKLAKEKLFALIGGKQKIKRRKIIIEGLKVAK